MASAKKVRVPEVFEIHLVLTADEAQTLKDVCGHVCGPNESRRRHIATLSQALTDVGFLYGDNTDIRTEVSSIYFK